MVVTLILQNCCGRIGIFSWVLGATAPTSAGPKPQADLWLSQTQKASCCARRQILKPDEQEGEA